MSLSKNKISITKIYPFLFKTVKAQPRLLLPFLIFAGIEALVLYFIFLIPRQPLRPIFGPIIVTFWGEKFLHYPFNILLLDKLSYLSRMLLSVIFGSLLTGVAVVMVRDAYDNRPAVFKTSFFAGLKKYASLFLILLLVSALMYFSIKFLTIGLAKYFIAGHKKLLFLGAKAWLGPALIVLSFLMSVLIQSFFVFSIPALMLENRKLFAAIGVSFAFCKKNFVQAVLLVGLPLLLYIPILILKLNAGYFISTLFPESFLLVLYLAIVVNSLVIDPLVTIATTLLFLEKREQ